jgi:hypothetical protein
MTDSPDGFRKGAAAYRNAGDWAKERRDRFINETNRQAENTTTESPSFRTTSSQATILVVTAAISLESDTSADVCYESFRPGADRRLGLVMGYTGQYASTYDETLKCGRRYTIGEL